MPTYEYECAKCGNRFEKFQSITAPPAKTCPSCKSRRVKRLLSTGAGVIFKGGGFYETDYKKKKAPPAKSSGDGAASAAPASGSKTDSGGGSGGTATGGKKKTDHT